MSNHQAGDVRQRALDALETAIVAHEEARKKVAFRITRKHLNGEDTSEDAEERADLDVTLGNLETERTEYRAAVSVTSAPTPAEIAAVRSDVEKIGRMTVEEAALESGRQTIAGILRSSLDLTGKNKMT
jgi:hypothetical protein